MISTGPGVRYSYSTGITGGGWARPVFRGRPPVGDPPGLSSQGESRRGFLKSLQLGLLAGLLPGGWAGALKARTLPAGGLTPARRRELRRVLETFRVREKALDFFEDARHPRTGLYYDRLLNRPGPLFSRNNYLSLSATGYGLAAEVLKAEAGRITKREVARRLEKTLETVEALGRPENGYFLPHFIHRDTGENVAEISTVDTMLFYLGAMAAAQYCSQELIARVNRMFRRLDFEKMRSRDGRDPDSDHISHGLDKNGRLLKAHWGGPYSEGVLLVNLMALAAEDDHRKLAPVWTRGWDRSHLWKQSGKSTFYNHPLFTYFYGPGFFNLKNKVDGQGTDFWQASRNAALMQQDYCREKGYPGEVFGLSACDGPNGYRVHEPGYDDGTIAPPAILACLPFSEDAVARALPYLQEQGLLDRRYGPTNAYNVFTGWTASDAVGIDVGSMLLMLDAWEGGTIHRLIGENELVRLAMTRAGFREKPPAG